MTTLQDTNGKDHQVSHIPKQNAWVKTTTGSVFVEVTGMSKDGRTGPRVTDCRIGSKAPQLTTNEADALLGGMLSNHK